MAEVKIELLFKELSSRVDELEDKNAALKLLLTAMIASNTQEQSQQLKQYLSDWKKLTLQGQIADSNPLLNRLREIESVVGELK